MSRSYLAAVVAAVVLPLAAGCAGTPLAQSLLPEDDERQSERWSWSCPDHRKRWYVLGIMDGWPTARDAAHFYSGKERVQIRRTGRGKAVAIVRGVEGLGGPSRLRLQKFDGMRTPPSVRGEWAPESAVVCEPKPSN